MILGAPAPTAHRPWPVPRGPWVLFMRWEHLAFLHWPVDPDHLRRLLPPGLSLDTFGDTAWLGLTPFLMSGVRARLTPPLPGISSFPEMNLRTYVSAEGKPGIWFFSLDAANSLAVRGARWTYHLPYYPAKMALEVQEDGEVRYESERLDEEDDPVRFRASYKATGPVYHADPGTLEHWLTERYCLYSHDGDCLYRGEVHHAPWPLQVGEPHIHTNTMAAPLDLSLEPEPMLTHVARQLDVVAWPPKKVGPGSRV